MKTVKYLTLSVGMLLLIACASGQHHHHVKKDASQISNSDKRAVVDMHANDFVVGQKVDVFSADCKAIPKIKSRKPQACTKQRVGEAMVVELPSKTSAIVEPIGDRPGILLPLTMLKPS